MLRTSNARQSGRRVAGLEEGHLDKVVVAEQSLEDGSASHVTDEDDGRSGRRFDRHLGRGLDRNWLVKRSGTLGEDSLGDCRIDAKPLHA